MRDVVFLALVVAFFLLAAAYVTACERIATGDEDAGTGADEGRPTAAGRS